MGIEIDAHRAEQAKALGIQTLQANALDVRCPAEGISLLYLNPPYDFEAGANGNQRLERVFLEHTYRWLKPAGVLVFVIPQPQLQPCARLLAEHFTNLRLAEGRRIERPWLITMPWFSGPVAGHSAVPSAVAESAGVEPASLLREPLLSRQVPYRPAHSPIKVSKNSGRPGGI